MVAKNTQRFKRFPQPTIDQILKDLNDLQGQVDSLQNDTTGIKAGDDIGELTALQSPVAGSRIYGRTYDRRSLLDFATTKGQRTAMRNGNVSPRAVWDDIVDDRDSNGTKLMDLPAGNYSLDDGESLDSNNGMYIYGLGQATVRKYGLGSLFRIIQPKPDVASGVALSSDSLAGSMGVVVVPGGASQFKEQTWCVLVCENAIRTGNTAKTGEFVLIQNINGNVISFWKRLEHSYTTASFAKLVNVNLVEGVGFENINAIMDPNATLHDSNSFQEMFTFDLRWCLGAVLRNVSGRDGLHALACLHGCVNTQIDGLRGFHYGSTTTGSADPYASDGTPGYGYGIREDGLNTGLIANNLYFDAMRHGYTTIAGYFDVDRLNYGWNSGTSLSNGIHKNARNMAWDFHWSGSGLQCDNLLAFGGRYGAYQVRSEKVHLRNCVAIDMTGPAFWIRGGNASSSRGDGGIYDNLTAIRTNLGISYDDAIDWRDIGAVLDNAFDSTITGLNVVNSGGPAITMGTNGIGRRGIYRNITARDICQLSAGVSSVIEIANANTSANLVIDTVVCHCSDGKVSDLIHREVPTSGGVPISVDMNNIQGYGHTGTTYSSVTNTLGMTLRNSP